MPFTPETLRFLFENYINNSREWYAAHRDEYKQYVVAPFRELVTALRPAMLEIDSQILCDSNKAPRVVRDTRILKYSKDKSLYRDHVWCTFGRQRELYEAAPAFYFQLSPNGFEYGCGYYKASVDSMNSLRGLILNKDRDFKKVLKSLEKSDYAVYGESYKRDHYPAEDRQAADWLNRKTIGISATSNDSKLLLSDNFADFLAESFCAAAPFYHFLMKAESFVKRSNSGE